MGICRVLGILICCMMTFQLVAQVEPTEPGVTEKSASYYLPKTALRFVLKVEGRTYHPGIFCKYTQKYYNIVPDMEQKTTYSVTNLGLSSIGIPDTTRLFTIQLIGKSKGADILLSPEGQLLAFNDEPSKVEEHIPFVPAPKPTPVDLLSYLPAMVRAAETEEAMVEAAVRYMISLRKNIQRLKSGEPVDSTCTETLEEMEKKNDVLDQLFFGHTTCDTTEQIVVVVPEREMEREIIFRLDEKTGIISQTAEHGQPYRLTVENMHSTPKQQEELPKEKKKGCVYVMVPSRIRATVYHDNHEMGRFDLYAGQFGFVDELSGSLFRDYVTHIKLNPTIGSVDKIRSEIK